MWKIIDYFLLFLPYFLFVSPSPISWIVVSIVGVIIYTVGSWNSQSQTQHVFISSHLASLFRITCTTYTGVLMLPINHLLTCLVSTTAAILFKVCGYTSRSRHTTPLTPRREVLSPPYHLN